MAAPVPISYYVQFQDLTPVTRQAYLHELAGQGAKYVVLSSPLLAMILGNPDLLQTVCDELKAEGLQFLDSHAPYGPHWDLNSPFAMERPALSARLKAVMEIVASLQLDTMTIHMGTDLMAPELPAQVHFDRACAMLETLLPDAERLGITICLENGMIRNYRTETLLAVLEKFQSDHLGFCFDAGHANVMDKGRAFPDCRAITQAAIIGEEPDWEPVAEKMKKMLPYIVNCHLHDNNAREDQHTLPGRGCADWELITATLRKAPKLRVIQSEVAALRNRISAAELVQAFDRIFRSNDLP